MSRADSRDALTRTFTCARRLAETSALDTVRWSSSNRSLTQLEIEQIVDLMASGLRARLADRSMTLDLEEDARAFIARQGFDPVYGARPLRRFIAREVETPVARALVAGDMRDGAVIKVGLTGGKLALSYDNPA